MKSWDFQGKNKKELMENINQWLNRYYKNMCCKVNDLWDFRLIDNQTNTRPYSSMRILLASLTSCKQRTSTPIW